MTEAGELCASFTVVRYSAGAAALGVWHMAAQRPLLRRVPGMRFGKLLGTGSGAGFSKKPDLLTWALFAVWENEEAWESFRSESRVMEQYRSRGDEVYSLLFDPLGAHGRWGGVDPFGTLPHSSKACPDDSPLVVLTRATIRLRRQWRFWSAVPQVDRSLRDKPELLLSFGVGEVPYLRQGTLSVWSTEEAMKQWAYGSEMHRDVIRRTRTERWYSEELFARFRLLRTYGLLNGRDPLAGRCNPEPG